MRTNMVILSNTIVTKHELGRARLWLHGVSSGADAEETEGECQRRKGWPPSTCKTPDAPWCKDCPGTAAAARSPPATPPHEEIDELCVTRRLILGASPRTAPSTGAAC